MAECLWSPTLRAAAAAAAQSGWWCGLFVGPTTPKIRSNRRPQVAFTKAPTCIRSCGQNCRHILDGVQPWEEEREKRDVVGIAVLSRMLVFFKKLASLADNCGQTTNSQIITSNTQSQYLFFLPLSISTKLSSFSLLSFFPPKKGAVF